METERDVDHEQDEQELVRRAQAGDAAAFATLYRRHVATVHAFAWRRTGSRDAAEDVTAATFERAWRAIPQFRWRSGFRPWLYRIAANECADHHRRRFRAAGVRAQRALRLVSEPASTDAPDELVDREDDLARLRRALDGLSPRLHEAVALRHLAGLSADEAAAVMGCSKPVLAVTLHRAMNALRSHLTEEDIR